MKTWTVVVIAGFCLLVGGCQTTVNTIEPIQPTAEVRELIVKKTQTDPSLSQRLKVLRVITSTGASGYLNVQVDLKNTSQSALRYTYRVEWFDEKGILIPNPAYTAIPRLIEGGEIQSIVVTAPSPQAKDFRIKFQEPTN